MQVGGMALCSILYNSILIILNEGQLSETVCEFHIPESGRFTYLFWGEHFGYEDRL